MAAHFAESSVHYSVQCPKLLTLGVAEPNVGEVSW